MREEATRGRPHALSLVTGASGIKGRAVRENWIAALTART